LQPQPPSHAANQGDEGFHYDEQSKAFCISIATAANSKAAIPRRGIDAPNTVATAP